MSVHCVKTEVLQKKKKDTEALLETSKEVGLLLNLGTWFINPCFLARMHEKVAAKTE
jgi:hypothetical protein